MSDEFLASRNSLLAEINRYTAYCDKWWSHNSKVNKFWFFSGIALTTTCAIVSLAGDSLVAHAGVIGGVGTLVGTSISTIGKSLKYDRKAMWYGTACSTLNAWKLRVELKAKTQEDLDGIIDLLEQLEQSEPNDQPEGGIDYAQLFKPKKS